MPCPRSITESGPSVTYESQLCDHIGPTLP